MDLRYIMAGVLFLLVLPIWLIPTKKPIEKKPIRMNFITLKKERKIKT